MPGATNFIAAVQHGARFVATSDPDDPRFVVFTARLPKPPEAVREDLTGHEALAGFYHFALYTTLSLVGYWSGVPFARRLLAAVFNRAYSRFRSAYEKRIHAKLPNHSRF